jgi:serine/threonine protein kinase
MPQLALSQHNFTQAIALTQGYQAREWSCSLLVFLDKSLNVKLGDFGLSRTIGDPENEFAQTYVGTPYYMSPELVDGKYNTKSDIWSLGCLIYELCALEPPFQAKTQAVLSEKIKSGKTADLPLHYTRDLQNVIRSMFILDVTNLISMNQDPLQVTCCSTAGSRNLSKRRKSLIRTKIN